MTDKRGRKEKSPIGTNAGITGRHGPDAIIGEDETRPPLISWRRRQDEKPERMGRPTASYEGARETYSTRKTLVTTRGLMEGQPGEETRNQDTKEGTVIQTKKNPWRTICGRAIKEETREYEERIREMEQERHRRNQERYGSL